MALRTKAAAAADVAEEGLYIPETASFSRPGWDGVALFALLQASLGLEFDLSFPEIMSARSGDCSRDRTGVAAMFPFVG